MSTTIFCTFDQQDMADLAIGKLRSSVHGIHSVEYLSDYRSHSYNEPRNALRPMGVWGYGIGSWGYGFDNSSGVQPSHPVSVKIVCDEGVRQHVVGKLVNLHAYKIVSS